MELTQLRKEEEDKSLLKQANRSFTQSFSMTNKDLKEEERKEDPKKPSSPKKPQKNRKLEQIQEEEETEEDKIQK